MTMQQHVRLFRLLLTLVATATTLCHAQSVSTVAENASSTFPSSSELIVMGTSSFLVPDISMTETIAMPTASSPIFSSIVVTSSDSLIPTPSSSLSPSPPLSSMTMTSSLASPVESMTTTVMTTTSSVVVTTSSSSSVVTTETSSTTRPPTTVPTSDPTSEPVLGTAGIIAIAAVGGVVLAVVVLFSLFCLCYCLRKSRHSATYDATRGRPVYVVRRWDERTEHVPNRGGSFRESKGSFARSSIRSSISSIASMVRGSLRRSRNNSLSRSGADTIANPQVLTVTPL